MTRTALDQAGLSGSLAEAVATVDELGWLYLAHPMTGLVRIAVAKPLVTLQDTPALAAASGSTLSPQVLDLELAGEQLLLAVGSNGLLAADRSGTRVERVYDVFGDAENAGFSGPEAAVQAISKTPLGEPLIAVLAGGKSYIAVLQGSRWLLVGAGPIANGPVVRGGLAHLGGGGYLLFTPTEIYWFNLAGTAAAIGKPSELLSALRALGAGQDEAEAKPIAAYDGCGGRTMLQVAGGLLRITVGDHRTEPGDVLLVQPDQQSVVRLVRGRDPVPCWPPRALASPSDAAVSRAGLIYIVDAGARTVFRLEPSQSEPMAIRGPSGSPISVVLDGGDRPIIGDLSLVNGQGPGVVRTAPDGSSEEVITAGEPLGSPTDLLLDGNGNVLVADSQAGRIWRLSPEVGSMPVAVAEIEAPRAIALGEAGTLYVASVPSRSQPGIFQVSSTGTVQAMRIGAPLVYPTGMVLLPQGDLLIADGKADPLEEIASGQAKDAGAIFLLEPANDQIRPILDAPLIRRNPVGSALALVAGIPEADCSQPPRVVPPARDPREALIPEPQEEEETGCSLVRTSTDMRHHQLLLLGLLIGWLISRPKAT